MATSQLTLTLPSEIIEWIFVFCDSKTLAVSIPRASKLFKKLSDDNSIVWKAKCEQKCLEVNAKPSDRTWKRYYYFPDLLKLFPFHGFTISKATQAEILAFWPDAIAKKAGNTHYVEYKSHNFWIIEGVFDMLYIGPGDKLPEEWTRQGLTWNISRPEVKELLKTKVGNYQVEALPQDLQDELYFTAMITSVVREVFGEDEIYYTLSFDFNCMIGGGGTFGTLNQIVIQCASDVNTSKQLYNEHKCKD